MSNRKIKFDGMFKCARMRLRKILIMSKENERFFLTDHPTMWCVRNGTHKKHKIFQPEMVVDGREIVRLKALMLLSKMQSSLK